MLLELMKGSDDRTPTTLKSVDRNYLQRVNQDVNSILKGADTHCSASGQREIGNKEKMEKRKKKRHDGKIRIEGEKERHCIAKKTSE